MKRILQIVLLVAVLLLTVSLFGTISFASEGNSPAETTIETVRETLVPDAGNHYKFYSQKGLIQNEDGTWDYRIVCVINLRWLLEAPFAEVKVIFSSITEGDPDVILSESPKTVYQCIYGFMDNIQFEYSAETGYVLFGWIVRHVPEEYAPNTGEIDTDKPSYTEGLEYALNADGKSYSVVGIGSASDTDIVIPATHKGLPVTEIGQMAFSDCAALTSVAINGNIKRISQGAFSRCTSLINVTIDAGVMSIGDGAFQFCGNLANITIPDSIANIGYTAFNGCDKLSYTADHQAQYLGNQENPYVVLIKVTDTSITNFTLYEKTKIIYDAAFRECYELENISISSGVMSIGRFAFEYCDSLLYATDHQAQYLGNQENPYMVLMKGNDSSITSFTLSEKTKIIYDSAFSDCTSLTSITIPDSVTSIGANAFFGCNKLLEICNFSSLNIVKGSFHNGYIGYYALNVYSPDIDESKLHTTDEGYIFYADGTTVYLLGYVGSDINLTLPSDYNGRDYEIYQYAFYGYFDLTSINIPDGVTGIGDRAFFNCHSLTSITIPDSVTSIGASAFYGCKGLTNITIPNRVTSIEEYAFSGCESLTSIIIPDGVTSIGANAFSGCRNLRSITIPDKVTSIEANAFSGCRNLRSITIPDKVTSIERETFSYCYNLLSVTIGNNVESIGDSAFIDCTSLTGIILPDSVTSIGNSAFYSCTSLTSITIPDSVTSIGISAFSWCESLTSIILPDSVTSIEMTTFDSCYNLLSVTIGNNVESISRYAFIDCHSLGSITIPDGVTSIGYGAFANCESLTSIILPDSITGIGASAFNGCCNLRSITIPDKVTSIEMTTFGGCYNLLSVTIGNNVESIGDSAFIGCTSLTSINFTGTEDEWNAIIKGSDWNQNTGNYTITYNCKPE